MSILTRIRQYIGRRITANLATVSLFSVSAKADRLTVAKVRLKPGQRGLLGLIPTLDAEQTHEVPALDLVKSPFRAAYGSMEGALNELPQRASDLAQEALTKKAAGDKEVAAAMAQADAILSRFAAQQLQPLIRTDRNKFREQLLENIGAQAGEIFATIARKHLAELVLRVRQEAAGEESQEGLLALPTGTRFVHQKGKMTIFVIEQPPQMRTIKVMDEAGTRSQAYQLAMPYVVFFVVMRGRRSDKMYVLFRRAPLRSPTDLLLKPSLTNIFEDYHVCFAPSAAKETLAITAEESVGNFWGGRFLATDATANLQIGIDVWAQRSAKDPFFGTSHQWSATNKTVNDMLRHISREFTSEPEEDRTRSKPSVLSALDSTLENMASEIANETKEACFRAVTQWKLPGEQIAKLQEEYAAAIAEMTQLFKDQVSKQAQSLFAEGTIAASLKTAAKKALTELNRSEEQVGAQFTSAIQTAFCNGEMEQ